MSTSKVQNDRAFERDDNTDNLAALIPAFETNGSKSPVKSSEAADNFLKLCGLSIDFGEFGGSGGVGGDKMLAAENINEKNDNKNKTPDFSIFRATKQLQIAADIPPKLSETSDQPREKSDKTDKFGTRLTNTQEREALQKIASPPVRFLGAEPDRQRVIARQLTDESKVTDSTGATVNAQKGDWIVSDIDNNEHLVQREEFLKLFKPETIDVKAPIQKYIKTLPIQAELITKDTPWQNPDAAPGSPPEMAKAGDYFAKPQGQAPYVIPNEYFKANYVQIPGSGEYARTSITKAQVLTENATTWSKNSGITSGVAGDYLITRENGNQEILSAQKFHEQFANAEQAAIDREPLSKPKAIGPRFEVDAAKGVTAERWEKGLIVYDGKSVTVTDETTGSSKEYVEGRLARERGTTIAGTGGERVISRMYTYGDLETVRQLPSLDSYKDLLERRPELKRAQELADTMPMTHYDNSAERVALREKVGREFQHLIDNLRKTPANDGTGAMKLEQGKKLNIVLGLSGSGKSTIANEISTNNHAYVADVDEIKRSLPEWQGGIGAGATAVEAHLINNPLIAEQLGRGDNLVVPVVGANTHNIEKLIEQAKKNGYEISLTLVDVPPTEAMKRIVARLANGGLYVDPNYLSSLGNRPAANFRELVEKHFIKGDAVTHFAQISNFGKTPVLVAEGHIRGAANTSGLARREFFAEGIVNIEKLEDTNRRSQMPDQSKEQIKPVETPALTDSKPLSKDAVPQVGEKPVYATPPNDTKTENGLPKLEIVKPGDLAKITDEKTFREAVQDLVKQAKEGKDVTFSVDARVAMTGADNKPIKASQASLLYDELKIAYPDRAFVFAKPDLKPGDKGYTEILAPKVTTDGLQISTKENAITLNKELTLSDGNKIPAGSKFAVGTTYDGKQFRSADPESKVWAITPEGQYMQVAEAGKGFEAAPDTISTEPNKRGQVADIHQKGINPTTGKPYENHLIVRTANEKAPDGRPLLDVYPSGGPGFENAYKPGASEGFFAAKAKSADHLLLPSNVTVNAETKYGNSTAAGKDGTYYMDSGFGDAKDATAKNYTGETDPRSAKELLRIRAELGMTESTQVEAGLAKSLVTQTEKIPDRMSEVMELAKKTENFSTAEKCVEWLKRNKPEGFADKLLELAKGDSRAAVPALQALADRPETAYEATKLGHERWSSGEFMSMLKENKIDLGAVKKLFANANVAAPDIYKEAWLGSADSPETRARLAQQYLNSSEHEGARKWIVSVPDELRRLALDFVVENRPSGFEATLAGAAKMQHSGISDIAAAAAQSRIDPPALKPVTDLKADGTMGSQSTKIIDLQEQAARTQVADAAAVEELRNSEVIRNVLKDAGMDMEVAKRLERQLTSKDEKEREAAVKEIDKHFEEKSTLAKSASDAHTSGTEGKTIEEKLRGWKKFESNVKANKGKLATIIILTAPIVAGLMRQENSKPTAGGSTFSK